MSTIRKREGERHKEGTSHVCVYSGGPPGAWAASEKGSSAGLGTEGKAKGTLGITTQMDNTRSPTVGEREFRKRKRNVRGEPVPNMPTYIYTIRSSVGL